MSRRLTAALLAALLAACASRGTEGTGDAGIAPRTDTSGTCAANCDAAAPSIPELTDTSGYGDVTTYGNVADPRPSAGGACNYGPTGIPDFAAIQVDRIPGDGQGQWRGGRVCGQCAEVRARTLSGWKSVVVRIVDKCPDANCGIDLGGAPAKTLMADKPGRYSGEWRFVPCDGHPGASDGAPTLQVKDGSNAWWSIVQVRNPSERILSMRIRKAGTAAWTDLEWAAEAENFYHVPAAALQDEGDYEVEAAMPHGRYALKCKGTALAQAKSSLALASVP
jgi:hypothetical protein